GTTANLCASSGTAAPPNLNFDTGQLFDPASEYNYTCPADPANPNAGTTTILAGTPIPRNMITTLDPVAQKVLALFPAPNTPGIVNYTNQTPQTQQNNQFDVRVDGTLAKVNTIFVRYMLGNSNIVFPEFELYPNFSFQNFPTWGDGFPGYFPVAAPDSIEKFQDTFTKVIGRH